MTTPTPSARWSESTIKAARRLPLRGLSAKDWTEQLDDMEAAYKARPSIWERICNPMYDVVDQSGVEAPAKAKKAPVKKAKKRSKR